MTFDVLYTTGKFYVMNEYESHGPCYYTAETQEKCDELNKNKD